MGLKSFAVLAMFLLLSACGKKEEETDSTTNNNLNNGGPTIPTFNQPPSTPTPTPAPTPTPPPTPGVPAGLAPQIVAPRYGYDSAVARANGEFCSQVGEYPGVPTTVVNTAFLSQPVTGTCQQVVLSRSNLATFANNLNSCTQKVSSGSCRTSDPMEQQSLLFVAKSANGCSRSLGIDSYGSVRARVKTASFDSGLKNAGYYSVVSILNIYVDLIRVENQRHLLGPDSITCMALPNEFHSVTMAGGILSVKQVVRPCGDSSGGAPGSASMAMANFSDSLFNIYAAHLVCP